MYEFAGLVDKKKYNKNGNEILATNLTLMEL